MTVLTGIGLTIVAGLVIAGVAIKFDFPIWAGMLTGLAVGALIGLQVQ